MADFSHFDKAQMLKVLDDYSAMLLKHQGPRSQQLYKDTTDSVMAFGSTFVSMFTLSKTYASPGG